MVGEGDGNMVGSLCVGKMGLVVLKVGVRLGRTLNALGNLQRS